jgi:ACS family tartrate transporter-like MFS transporter
MTTVPRDNVTSGSDLEAKTVNTLLWRLLPFLFLLYVVNYLDRINVGFAALQMRTQLRFTDDVFGTAFGVFFIGYSVLQVPSNLALARVGARRWMAAIMVLWGVVSCCMITVHTVRGFYLLRAALGVAEAGFFPGIILYLKSWFPASARARAAAWFLTANPLAGVVGGPISGALLGLRGHGLAGWQWMFILEGVPAIILAIVVLFTLKDHPRDADWLQPDEKLWLIYALEHEHAQHTPATRVHDWKSFVLFLKWVSPLSWRIALMIIVYFGLTASAYGLILWMPNYIHSLSSLSNFGIGVASVVPYIATAAGMVLVGMSSDRTGRHRLHLAGAAFSAAVFLLIAAQMTSIVPGLAFVSLALMATFSMQGPFWATSTSFLGGTAAAAGIAVINSLGNLGGYFGPKIIGLSRMAGGGFRGGMLIISICLALAGIVSLVVRGRQQPSSSAAGNPLQ